ncbi:anti-sigma-F factor Fin family protein [Bacillus massilinigeriensis]|uniref:anti-sigma-F factor Fin family protein n=1 Tax=Bacillus massilionigeriensis TaxID=1805475 RepID=UPI00096AED8C|nr:anti-sigma-F factor Fin family protein [Bacillus massilionigeriensis]
MAIHYHCRHCGVEIGTLENQSVDTNRLGFHKLTDDERLEMISYSSKGDIHIKSICEDCQELLQRNPDYYQYDFLIH